MTSGTHATLSEQRESFKKQRFMASPISGLIVWLFVGLSGLFLTDRQTVWVLFIGTGSIVYLGMFISRFTGENFMDKSKPKNAFDTLFFYTVAMALLVYSIAIPFFIIDYSSFPLTVGILTGLMWLPFSWIVQHWVGIFHTVARTFLIVGAWYTFPKQRFVIIPFIIVFIYCITLVVLDKRWKEANGMK
jgi:hypothetical protein